MTLKEFVKGIRKYTVFIILDVDESKITDKDCYICDIWRLDIDKTDIIYATVKWLAHRFNTRKEAKIFASKFNNTYKNCIIKKYKIKTTQK